MVAQDETALRSEVVDETRLLGVEKRDPLVVVIAERRDRDGRLLRDGQQPAGLSPDCDAGGGVAVQDTRHILACRVNGAVDDEASRVHRIVTRLEERAVGIDLEQAAGGDLLEQHPVRVDEEGVLRARHPGGDVGEDKVIPAVEGHQPVAGGEVGAQGEFGRFRCHGSEYHSAPAETSGKGRSLHRISCTLRAGLPSVKEWPPAAALKAPRDLGRLDASWAG